MKLQFFVSALTASEAKVESMEAQMLTMLHITMKAMMRSLTTREPLDLDPLAR